MSQDLICMLMFTGQNMQGIKAGMEGRLITGTMTGINHTGVVEMTITGVMTIIGTITITGVMAITKQIESFMI